jgi:hypothetical protein
VIVLERNMISFGFLPTQVVNCTSYNIQRTCKIALLNNMEYRGLVEEPKEKRFRGRPGRRMGDNIKLDLPELP